MQILRWSAAAALAAMVCAVPSYAGDNLTAMKASMDSMKIEMEALRSQMAAEREALRATAGGAPEGLTGAKGNATIRIGGDVRFQYRLGWGNGYGRQGYTAYDEAGSVPGTYRNYKSTCAGWNVARAEIDFDIDLSCDTKGFVSLRFDEGGSLAGVKQLGGQTQTNILDNAWWRWSNAGGTGLSLKAGLQDMPFGMWANTDMGGYDFDGVDRPLIANPFTRRVGNAGYIPNRINLGDEARPFPFDPISWAVGSANRNVTNLGLVAAYSWDDRIVLKAGVMAGGVNNYTLNSGNSLTYDNQIRNIGLVDHVIALGWNPCWLEGLHVEASYMGTFDQAMDGQVYQDGASLVYVRNNPYAYDYTRNHQGDSSYRPSFDLGVSYKINDQWKVYAEGVLAWQPYYSDGFAMALTAGVDYRMTEKLMLGFGFDWMHASYNGDSMVGDMFGYLPAPEMYANLYRINVGAKYDFGNGLYFQAQYYHDLAYISGVRDQDTKDADTILLQTGYRF